MIIFSFNGTFTYVSLLFIYYELPIHSQTHTHTHLHTPQLYWYFVYKWFHTTSFTFIQRKNFLMPLSANKAHTLTHTHTHTHTRADTYLRTVTFKLVGGNFSLIHCRWCFLPFHISLFFLFYRLAFGFCF